MIDCDKGKCVRDGICSKICPMYLFSIGVDQYPILSDKASELCMSCGHCISHCPKNALSFKSSEGFDYSEFTDVVYDAVSTLENSVVSRRSVRFFKKNERIAKAKLEEIIEIAKYAPTAKNIRSLQLVVVDDSEKIKNLAKEVVEDFRQKGNLMGLVKKWDSGVDLVLRAAPQLIICLAKKDSLKPKDDSCILLTTIDLLLHQNGFGGCWAGFFTDVANVSKSIRSILQIDDQFSVEGALMVGKPAFKSYRPPPRKKMEIRFL